MTIGVWSLDHVTNQRMLLLCQCKVACDESMLSCDIHSLDNLCGHSNHIENIFPLPPLRVLFLFMTSQGKEHLITSGG